MGRFEVDLRSESRGLGVVIELMWKWPDSDAWFEIVIDTKTRNRQAVTLRVLALALHPPSNAKHFHLTTKVDIHKKNSSNT